MADSSHSTDHPAAAHCVQMMKDIYGQSVVSTQETCLDAGERPRGWAAHAEAALATLQPPKKGCCGEPDRIRTCDPLIKSLKVHCSPWFLVVSRSIKKINKTGKF
jgi:hypothetical protein